MRSTLSLITRPPELAIDLLTGPHAVLSIDEAAVVLRVNRKTVSAMIERGDLPDVRYARRRWIPTAS